MDKDRRLVAGPEVESLLFRMYRRTFSAQAVLAAGLGLTVLLLRSGPALSKSTPNSIAVAGAVCFAVILPFLILQAFLEPFGGASSGPKRRAVGMEEYVHPLVRVLVWLGTASMTLVPLGAVLLSSTDRYDGNDLFWEGLVAVPAVSIALLVLLELSVRDLRDDESAAPALYYWDAIRSRSVRTISVCILIGSAVAWNLAAGATIGVAMNGARPTWVEQAHQVAYGIGLVFGITAILLMVVPHTRVRRTLWPDLDRGQRVRF